MKLIRQNDENKSLFWLIYHALLLLSLINLNVYFINICYFDFFIWIY